MVPKFVFPLLLFCTIFSFQAFSSVVEETGMADVELLLTKAIKNGWTNDQLINNLTNASHEYALTGESIAKVEHAEKISKIRRVLIVSGVLAGIAAVSVLGVACYKLYHENKVYIRQRHEHLLTDSSNQATIAQQTEQLRQLQATNWESELQLHYQVGELTRNLEQREERIQALDQEAVNQRERQLRTTVAIVQEFERELEQQQQAAQNNLNRAQVLLERSEERRQALVEQLQEAQHSHAEQRVELERELRHVSQERDVRDQVLNEVQRRYNHWQQQQDNQAPQVPNNQPPEEQPEEYVIREGVPILCTRDGDNLVPHVENID